MANIYLMRHADSPYNGYDDFNRQLSNKGVNQALKAAKYLKENFKLEHIISSNAPRALNTANYFEKEFKINTVYNNIIYSGSAEDIINNIEFKPNMLLIGHNPTIIELAKLICEDNSLYKNRNHFYNMTSAKIIIYEFFDNANFNKLGKFINSVEF